MLGDCWFRCRVSASTVVTASNQDDLGAWAGFGYEKPAIHVSSSSSKFQGIVGFTSTAMAYHVGRAGMHPLEQEATLQSPSLYIESLLRRSLDFHDLLIGSWVSYMGQSLGGAPIFTT